MAKKLGSLGIAVGLLCIPLLLMIGLTLITSGVGMSHQIGFQEPALTSANASSVPASVRADARKAAQSLADDPQQVREGFQLGVLNQ